MIYIYIDECNLYFTSLCGGVVRQIFDSLNLVLSLAGGSTEVRDLGADGNNRTLLSNIVSTRQVQLGQGTNSGGTTQMCMFMGVKKLNIFVVEYIPSKICYLQ